MVVSDQKTEARGVRDAMGVIRKSGQRLRKHKWRCWMINIHSNFVTQIFIPSHGALPQHPQSSSGHISAHCPRARALDFSADQRWKRRCTNPEECFSGKRPFVHITDASARDNVTVMPSYFRSLALS